MSEKHTHPSPMKVAIIGIGGFARNHHETILELEQQGAVRLLATCDPSLKDGDEGPEMFAFRARNVAVYHDYRSLLQNHANDLDYLVIPTPIPLHAEMHRAAVDAGISVYLEKPPTLDHEELAAMLAVEKRVRKATHVGFNFIVDPNRRALKQRLVQGDFGRLEQVRFTGLAPRLESYFTRNNWSGKLFVGDSVVADSGMGNAMAHFIHNLLFWAGSETLDSWATPESVHAELYRAHQIECADTFFVDATLAGGVRFRAFLTHSCGDGHALREEIHCANATLTYDAGKGFQVIWKDGRTENLPNKKISLLQRNHLIYQEFLRGEIPRPPTRLADTIPFVHLYNLTLLASGAITTLPENAYTRKETRHGKQSGHVRLIHGIEDIGRQFQENGAFPSAQTVPWARQGSTATPEDLPRYHEFLRSLIPGE